MEYRVTAGSGWMAQREKRERDVAPKGGLWGKEDKAGKR